MRVPLVYLSCCPVPNCLGKQGELSGNCLPNLTVMFILSPSIPFAVSPNPVTHFSSLFPLPRWQIPLDLVTELHFSSPLFSPTIEECHFVVAPPSIFLIVHVLPSPSACVIWLGATLLTSHQARKSHLKEMEISWDEFRYEKKLWAFF